MSRSYFSAVALVSLAGLAATGCGGDVCKAFGGKSCIAIEVRGPSGREIDELHVVATAGFTLDASTFKADHAPQLLPVQVPILPGDAYTGDFALGVDALVGGVTVGHADVSGTVSKPGQHLLLIANLAGALLEADFAMPLDSDGGVLLDFAQPSTTDGAMPPTPDLANVPPPADTECASVANDWVQTTKGAPSCDARKAIAFGTDPSGFLRAGITHISIARAPTGRVAAVYQAYGGAGPDTIALVASTFTGDTFPPTVTTVAIGGDTLGDREGSSPSITASADGTMNVCYLDTSDSGNTIQYRVLSNANAFGSPEQVASGLGMDGYVATAIDGVGRLDCVYYNRGNNTLFSKRRIAGAWDTTAAIVKAGGASTLSDRGRVSLTVDQGSVYAAYHYALTNTGAQPYFYSFDGTTWSSPKQVDNAANGTSKNFGSGADVVVKGGKTSVAYFAPNAGGKYDLRVATFGSVNDAPVYEDVLTNLTATVADAQLAMDVDPWGQLHIALINPSSSSSASLEYLRQYPNGAGGLKWLVDLVDPAAGAGSDSNAVDMIVDSRGRPHIVYYSGESGKLMYATRTDRN